MNVYVESNFVLELAFQREEELACQDFLKLAESGDILLAIPAFSVVEPYETFVRRLKQREETHKKLKQELGELARSKPYSGSPQEFQELTSLLLKSSEEEKRQLDQTLTSILRFAGIIPIDLKIIADAIALQDNRSLSPQDSIIYASVLEHLKTAGPGPHCFLTKNSRDFANPDIQNDLSSYDCKLLTRFSNGLGYVRSCL